MREGRLEIQTGITREDESLRYLAAIWVATAVQHHGEMRESSGSRNKSAPAVRIGFGGLEEGRSWIV